MRGQRGSATVLVAVVIVGIAALTALLVLVGVSRAEGQRVRGAADLAALAGARAQGAGQDACAEASRSAALNDIEVASCQVAGDEVEFVVTVEGRGQVHLGPWRTPLAARSHAGMLTGAPE